MKNYVVCPNRSNGKVSLDVCLKKCESRRECEELREVPIQDLHEAMKRLKIPIPQEEAEIVVDVIAPEIQAETPVVVLEKPPAPSESRALYDQVLSIRTEIEIKFLEMGKLLYKIFVNKYYRDYGYQDWKSFCIETFADMGWRTATYLRDIYEKMTELGVEQQECAQIGWSKLAQILPVVDMKNVGKWIAEAKKPGTTTEGLNTKVRLALGKITKADAENPPSKLMFSLYDGQLENVERALELAAMMTGSEKRGFNLEMIAVEFMITYQDAEHNGSKIEISKKWIKSIENLFKIKFRGDITDLETDEVLIEVN